MYILHETPAGYALIKIKEEGIISEEKEEKIKKEIEKKGINEIVSLEYLLKFENTEQAVEECQAINDGVMTSTLQKFLKATIKKEKEGKLIVVESGLSQMIKNKIGIETIYPNGTIMIDRMIREKIEEIIPEITPKEMHSMELGLSHNWSSFKIKFSPEKIDTMIIQAVSLLDDLDKEINIYSMRVREWYGWHFPELSKYINDHMAYCQLVNKIGMRENAKNVDMKEYVEPVVEEEIKNAAIVSMGSEISEEDLENIKALCKQTIEIVEYREELWEYLRQRMQAIAPNLSTLLGELIGARLICHTGSLINLAKAPGSTIQILGAEKALFRALKTKKKTPKYGLIFHAALIGQAPAKAKGQISRVIASKAALCARVDALADNADSSMGEKGKEMVEERLRKIETKAGSKNVVVNTGKYTRKQEDIIGNKKVFENSKDSTLGKEEKVVEEEKEETTSNSSSSSSESSSSEESSSSKSSESSSSESESEEEKKRVKKGKEGGEKKKL
ncbi:nucleolar protein 5, putative [Entamoeba histolytica HM-3:IMSS]|uniref:SnoRNA binding protein, putative n=5 Tax=Entamoeba histolytica TaxID=5759 RepID=C4MAW3_ENTH1|nr:snoRNA binding protein, putative [Entamoeba histolytica HM-1:IMSS]EMD45904.1 nucleolar protein, putative [Entamoeba histolytica KU27]EMS12974.1 nucleolar protein 5, putative [Entamoeba histolytica HM-3:IMSS]ENY64708.1 nucleolar protein 5, putative [Entamoeba histolytica HM-1:IMSS-A]GAT99003.1 snoRNA binding protein putative [Entamoeba histolytica]EAL42779.1 snoRNA binding protein, putative [Entamoeba histolytica HM-1:IMSS]|eukprot:XP_648166.1 snoRNA binding protein, putative [Entamoeba histolytica HM-1:IMSS]